MKSFLVLISILFVILFGSLTMSQENQASENNIHHIVVFWLKEPGNVEHRTTLIETTKSFTEIPGVLSVSAGLALPSDREVVDDSFDVAISMSFENEAAFQTYQSHPIHVKAQQKNLKSIVEKFIVYDFVD